MAAYAVPFDVRCRANLSSMSMNKKTEQQEHHMPPANLSRKLPSVRLLAIAALVAGASSAASAEELVGWAHPAVQAAFARDTDHGINKYEIAVNFNTPIQYGNPDGWLFRLQAEANMAAGTRAAAPIAEPDGVRPDADPACGKARRLLRAVPGGRRGLAPADAHVDVRPAPLGTAFQFGDMVGFGVGFGKNAATEVGMRFQHISNAGIKEPNPGTNLYTGYVRYRF
jgi:hypothetical protein